MEGKYRIKVIHINGKGNTKVNQTTNCIRTFRKTVAENNKVPATSVILTYEETEVVV